MRKNILFLAFICLFASLHAQEIVIPDYIKELNHKMKLASDYLPKVYRDPGLLPEAIKAYEEVINGGLPKSKYGVYVNYADLTAQSGDLEKAIHYYDTAFKYKFLDSKEFGYSYRRKYFEKDTLLYQRKMKEYIDYEENNPIYYTARELELVKEIKEIHAADQLARHYYDAYPQHQNCAKSILLYTDSTTMVRWLALLEKYPEYDDPLSTDFEASFVISRHIFTAYPQFWLTHFEPRCRKALIEGSYNPQDYAVMYDRCLISTTGGYSYYGEWDNDGMNANPDKVLVNKRRANLGLLPLEEKAENNFIVFPVYTD